MTLVKEFLNGAILTLVLSEFEGRISQYKVLVPCLSLRVKFTNR